MNYGDPQQQQQQYMVQRMVPGGQRMPMQMHSQGMPSNLPPQQQQQQQVRGQPINISAQYAQQMGQPGQMQPGMRMSAAVGGQPAMGVGSGPPNRMVYQSQQQHDVQRFILTRPVRIIAMNRRSIHQDSNNELNQLPQDVCIAIQNEPDPIRKKQMFNEAMRQRMMEQQQLQMGGGMAGMAGGGMGRMTLQQQQRIAAAQQQQQQQQHIVGQSQAGGMLYSNNSGAGGGMGMVMSGHSHQQQQQSVGGGGPPPQQPQMVGNHLQQQMQMSGGNMHLQRISNQGMLGTGGGGPGGNNMGVQQQQMLAAQQQRQQQQQQQANPQVTQQQSHQVIYCQGGGMPGGQQPPHMQQHIYTSTAGHGGGAMVGGGGHMTLQQLTPQQQQQFIQQQHQQQMQYQHQVRQQQQHNMQLHHQQQQQQQSSQHQPQIGQQQSTPQQPHHQTISQQSTPQSLLHQQQSTSSIPQPLSVPQQTTSQQSHHHQILGGGGPPSHHSVGGMPLGGPPPQQGASPMPMAHSQSSQQQGMVGGPSSVGSASILAQQPRSIPPSGSHHFIGSPSVQQSVAAVGGPGSARPGTPSNRSVSSVGGPHSVSSVLQSVDQNQPEYKAALELLKSYADRIKRLMMRIHIDYLSGYEKSSTLEKSVERVIEVIEGRRIVDLKLLERLVKNVRSTLSMYDPSRGLTDLLKKLPSEFAFAVQPSREILPDPWQDVRHLQISPPDHVMAQLKICEGMEEAARKNGAMNVSSLKRKADVDVEAEPAAKRERSVLEALANSFTKDAMTNSALVKTESVEEPPSAEEATHPLSGGAKVEPICVECLNGGWIRLNDAISTELRSLPLPYRFDEDEKPISEMCPHVPVRILYKSQSNVLANNWIPPLQIIIPVRYPEAVVQLGDNHADGVKSEEGVGNNDSTGWIFNELRMRVDAVGGIAAAASGSGIASIKTEPSSLNVTSAPILDASSAMDTSTDNGVGPRPPTLSIRSVVDAWREIVEQFLNKNKQSMAMGMRLL